MGLDPTPQLPWHAESGGICSFCGNRVALRYADGTTNVPAGEAEAGAGPSTAAAATASGQAAGELAGFKPEAQQGNAADAVAYNDSQARLAGMTSREGSWCEALEAGTARYERAAGACTSLGQCAQR